MNSKRRPIENTRPCYHKRQNCGYKAFCSQFSAVFQPLLKLSCLHSLFTKTKGRRLGVTERKQKSRRGESAVQRGCVRIKRENKSSYETCAQLYVARKTVCILISGRASYSGSKYYTVHQSIQLHV